MLKIRSMPSQTSAACDDDLDPQQLLNKCFISLASQSGSANITLNAFRRFIATSRAGE